MQKELRCCARKLLDREVMIGYTQSGFTRTRVRDIGLGGIRVDAAIPLAVDHPVELVFRTSIDGALQTHRWRATVRHVSSDGAGLKYEAFVLTELPMLLELLQAADRQVADAGRWGDRPVSAGSAVPVSLAALPDEPPRDERNPDYER